MRGDVWMACQSLWSAVLAFFAGGNAAARIKTWVYNGRKHTKYTTLFTSTCQFSHSVTVTEFGKEH